MFPDHEEVLKPARKHATDRGGSPAPRPVIQTLLSLTGGQLPEHSFAERTVDGEHTSWQVIWVLGGLVHCCSSSADQSDWELGSHDQTAASCEGTTHAVRNLRAVRVASVRDLPPQAPWEWESGYVLDFDGATITLPMNGKPVHPALADQVESLIAHIRTSWANA